MPFNQPWIGWFTAGDLIYGLAPSRQKLVIHLGAQIMTAGGPATVDQYRKTTMSTMTKEYRTTWRQFLRENEAHPRYQGYGQAIRSHDNDEVAFADSAKSSLQNAAWRAKSKFGMEWTLKNNRGLIHFVLDDIDMGAVVTKAHLFTDPISGDVLAQDTPRGKAPPDVEKERTITHSELRWIYRNRSNALVQAGIQFWYTVGPVIQCCGPPWENAGNTTTMPTSGAVFSWQKAWTIYKPTTERQAF